MRSITKQDIKKKGNHSMPIEIAVWMVVLPVEPEVFQNIDPCQTLSPHVSSNAASVKAEFAERVGFQQRPRFGGAG